MLPDTSTLCGSSGASPASHVLALAQRPKPRPPSAAAAARRSLRCYIPHFRRHRQSALRDFHPHTLATTHTTRAALKGACWGCGATSACVVSAGNAACAGETASHRTKADPTRTFIASLPHTTTTVPPDRRAVALIMHCCPVSQGVSCRRPLFILLSPRIGPPPTPPRGTARRMKWLGKGPGIAIVH